MNAYLLLERTQQSQHPRRDAVANKLDYWECAWLNFQRDLKQIICNPPQPPMLKEKLGFNLHSASTPLIGLDISSSAVKMVELAEGSKGSYRLERYVIEPLPK